MNGDNKLEIIKTLKELARISNKAAEMIEKTEHEDLADYIFRSYNNHVGKLNTYGYTKLEEMKKNAIIPRGSAKMHYFYL